MEIIHITTTEQDIGKRLDSYIAEKTDMTRSRIQNLIDEGNIELDNKQTKASFKLKNIHNISITIPEAKQLDMPFTNFQTQTGIKLLIML